MAYLLAEVDIHLQKLDESSAAELRVLVAELQRKRIIPLQEQGGA